MNSTTSHDILRSVAALWLILSASICSAQMPRRPLVQAIDAVIAAEGCQGRYTWGGDLHQPAWQVGIH